MKKILIATHGYFADGIKNTIKIITGKEEYINCINAYVDERDYTAEIKNFIDSVYEDDEAVIFTDLYCGSVNQKVMMMKPDRKKIYVITGFNLAVVLGILLSNEKLTEEVVDEIVADSASQLLKLPKKENEDVMIQLNENAFFNEIKSERRMENDSINPDR